MKLSLSDEPIKLDNLIGGLKYSWSSILKHDPNILSLLHDKEISKVAYLLLTDITSSEKNFYEWLNILDKECIQENKCFLTYLLSHTLVQIGQCFSSGCTKSITENINVVSIIQCWKLVFLPDNCEIKTITYFHFNNIKIVETVDGGQV